MSNKRDDSDSPPMIFKETSKLLECMEISEEQLYEIKCLLKHKETYYEQLQQLDNDLNKSNAEKRAALSIENDRASLINTKNSDYRDKGKNMYTSCNAACQDINDIKDALAECEQLSGTLRKNLEKENAQCEKKIDELTNLLVELTEKRKKGLGALQLQQNKLLEENLELNKQLTVYENEEDDSESFDSEQLENELKSLKAKITTLNEDFSRTSEENMSCDVVVEKAEQTYSKSIFAELETKLVEINDHQIPQLLQKLEEQTAAEQDATVSSQTLQDYVNKINEELAQTTKTCENLDQNEYGGFSALEQEIGKVRADVVDRNEKCRLAQEEKLEYSKSLKKENDEIANLTTIVDNFAIELKELENLLETLQSSDYLSEQYSSISDHINDLCREKTKLQEAALEQEEMIPKNINQLNNEKYKGDIEILTLENKHLLQIKELEKQCADIEASEVKMEREAKSAEDQARELENSKNALKEKVATITRDQKSLDAIIIESQKNLKLYTQKKEEAKKMLDKMINKPSAPPPIYLKKTEIPRDFAKPKTPEIAKRSPKKTSSSKAKRNWDSDSSMESGEILFSDFLKKKHKQ